MFNQTLIFIQLRVGWPLWAFNFIFNLIKIKHFHHPKFCIEDECLFDLATSGYEATTAAAMKMSL